MSGYPLRHEEAHQVEEEEDEDKQSKLTTNKLSKNKTNANQVINDVSKCEHMSHGSHTIVNKCLAFALRLNTQNVNYTNSLKAPARAAPLVSLLVASVQVTLASCGFCYSEQETCLLEHFSTGV